MTIAKINHKVTQILDLALPKFHRLFLCNSNEMQYTWGLSKRQTEMCQKGYKIGKAKGLGSVGPGKRMLEQRELQ